MGYLSLPLRTISGLAVLGAAAIWGMQHTGDSPIRVQVTTGGHMYETSFYGIFEGRKDLRIVLNPHPSAFQYDLRKYADVLVLYDLADVNSEAQRANLRNFLESGKGLVVLHHALADNQKWPWWYEEVVGGRYLMAAEGSTPDSGYKHDVPFKVTPVGRHPILNRIGPFEIVDEAYKRFWISPKVQVLLETDNPENEKPMAWVSPYQKSRVVYIQLGHGSQAHEHPVYRQLVNNAIRWVAGRLEQ